ncbi:MAG: hypothetical protein NBKEAIPA_01129 [Nitrospirae bacterium]|nr:MAG: hypothetical protein UZ03_NOB001002512 [Nitrospira sp. OLB3]MBV6469240.1 hypothetical protein [Nitrospirota bacterium]
MPRDLYVTVDGNRKPKAQRVKEGIEASNFRIAALREYAI